MKTALPSTVFVKKGETLPKAVPHNKPANVPPTASPTRATSIPSQVPLTLKHKVVPVSMAVRPVKQLPVWGLVIAIFGFFVMFGYIIPVQLAQVAAVGQQLANSGIGQGSTNTKNAFTKFPELRKDSQGRTNVLLVGVDTRETVKKGVSNVKNTDTVMLVTYDHKTHRITMVSIPRDTNVNFPGTPTYAKINAMYAFGEARKKGSGLEALKTVVEGVTGQKIQYYGMVDLKAFTTVIDQLGGIEVYVDRTFTGDYPNENFGMDPVSFTQGWTKMDGERALRYSRIRYANIAAERGDYARARRQQKVVQAVIGKVQSSKTLLNTKVVFEVLETLAANVKTSEISPDDIQAALHILVTKGKPESYSVVLDPGVAQYQLIVGYGPKAGKGNWTAVRAFVNDFVTEPLLYSAGIGYDVVNAGAASYTQKFRQFDNRFYYVRVYNAGTIDKRKGNFVYNYKGKELELLGKYLAAYVGGTYVDASTVTDAPKVKDPEMVIVYGE